VDPTQPKADESDDQRPSSPQSGLLPNLPTVHKHEMTDPFMTSHDMIAVPRRLSLSDVRFRDLRQEKKASHMQHD
jgi:hypothetical protein